MQRSPNQLKITIYFLNLIFDTKIIGNSPSGNIANIKKIAACESLISLDGIPEIGETDQPEQQSPQVPVDFRMMCRQNLIGHAI